MTSTTASSTANALDGVPPEHIDLVRKACDAYSKACKKAQAMRDARTAQCEALVIAAIQAKRARLEKEKRHKWTSILIGYFHMKNIQIDEETVRRIVKSFPGFL
jgi:hypothetical protein